MKGFFILSVLFFLVSCEISTVPLTDNPDDRQQRQEDDGGLTVRINQEEKKVFDLINNYRKNNGRAPLKWVNQAVLEAQIHSENMARINDVNHIGLSLRINIIVVEENIVVRAHGENAGMNKDSDAMVRAWINSFGHRRTLLGDYTHTGIGQAGSGSKKYYTQIFLKVIE